MKNNIFKLNGIGTIWSIEILDDIVEVQSIEKIVKNVISDFENNYSRFKKDSLLSQLNLKRELQDVPQEMLDIISLSIGFYNKTEKVFNIGIGKKLEQIGYDRNYSFEAKDIEVQIPDLNRLIKINGNKIYLLGEGDLDFGGIGKGFLIDKIVRILQKDFSLKYFVVNGGGDIYVTSDHGQEVEIFLQNPHNLSEILQPIKLKNASVCGSSPNLRKWKDPKTGKDYNHIIDSIRAKTATKSSFVISSKAVIADVLATTLIIKNDEEFIATLKKSYDFGLLLLD